MSINMRVIPPPRKAINLRLEPPPKWAICRILSPYNDQYEADTSTTMGDKYEVGTSTKMAIVMRLKHMPPGGDIGQYLQHEGQMREVETSATRAIRVKYLRRNGR